MERVGGKETDVKPNIAAIFETNPPQCCEGCLEPEAQDLRKDVELITADRDPLTDLDWLRDDLQIVECAPTCPWRQAVSTLRHEMGDRIQRRKLGLPQLD